MLVQDFDAGEETEPIDKVRRVPDVLRMAGREGRDFEIFFSDDLPLPGAIRFSYAAHAAAILRSREALQITESWFCQNGMQPVPIHLVACGTTGSESSQGIYLFPPSSVGPSIKVCKMSGIGGAVAARLQCHILTDQPQFKNRAIRPKNGCANGGVLDLPLVYQDGVQEYRGLGMAESSPDPTTMIVDEDMETSSTNERRLETEMDTVEKRLYLL
ncbi:hypothetical protein B0H14DRAFT_2610219 [Mycena olivaceomarginata]|nr:hypothetical protein B0H14DRAFT_2610219 [Mycena olivaceomarginata]